MNLNGISSIKMDAGDFLLLASYPGEGIHVVRQFETAAEAIQAVFKDPCAGAETAIVKLVNITDIEPPDPGRKPD